MVGQVPVGGDAPIVIQSMTNTDTADAAATVAQVLELARAGSEVVRITVNSAEAAAQVATIRQQLDDQGCNVPLVGDFHFNGDRLLRDYPDCARALAKYRINPGNVGKGSKGDEKIRLYGENSGRTWQSSANWGQLGQPRSKFSCSVDG